LFCGPDVLPVAKQITEGNTKFALTPASGLASSFLYAASPPSVTGSNGNVCVNNLHSVINWQWNDWRSKLLQTSLFLSLCRVLLMHFWLTHKILDKFERYFTNASQI